MATHSKVQTSGKEHFTGYLAIVAMLSLVASLAAAWFYLQSQPRIEPRAAFVDTGPMVVSIDGYNIATRMAVQTSKADGDWANSNRSALIQVLNHALATSNPKTLLTPQGLQNLQTVLADAGNAAMQTAKIQNVLLTEFLIQVAD